MPRWVRRAMCTGHSLPPDAAGREKQILGSWREREGERVIAVAHLNSFHYHNFPVHQQRITCRHASARVRTHTRVTKLWRYVSGYCGPLTLFISYFICSPSELFITLYSSVDSRSQTNSSAYVYQMAPRNVIQQTRAHIHVQGVCTCSPQPRPYPYCSAECNRILVQVPNARLSQAPALGLLFP